MSLFTKIGDRLLGLVVPKTTASAEAGWYTACYCHDYYTTWVYKYCDSSGCTPCTYLSNVYCGT